MRSTDPAKSGFTLLETLIAFTVFSLFLIAVHKSFVTGVKSEAKAEWSNEIGQAMRSEFARIEAGLVPGPFYDKDLFERYTMEVRISPAPDNFGDVPMHSGTLKLVRIRVHDGSGGNALEMRRLMTPEVP
ncbi:prepilin-type N-terminal cleavage/methylation domain-containing protein [Labrenzia sp. OB1]|uniref:PulJ/GspJ family protein n=1 Tax=Labrenzia sp. OB1 TaxID=1561204 RepID=UPI0007B1C615|nr:prepilin-type N-terminal cleavage/methylation domain-containing protein [Labrenzia sp. OB1]KZM47467.1 hypothetical protein OA90_25705 [Labrenzia sp. OB1]